jgi:hypothetical protein
MATWNAVTITPSSLVGQSFVQGPIVANLYVFGQRTVYKMKGWYATGAVWETWTASIPNTSSPSGHTLTNISYIELSTQ